MRTLKSFFKEKIYILKKWREEQKRRNKNPLSFKISSKNLSEAAIPAKMILSDQINS